MKKIMIATGLATLATLAGVAAAQTVDSRPRADVTRAQLVERLDARFAQLDTNRDGTVTAAERSAQREARRGQRFQRLDKDGNGALSPTEFAARGERGEGRSGGRGRLGRGGGKGVDANGDGTLSRAEFQARALARFDRGDLDRNGVLTAAERQQAREGVRAQRAR